MSSTGGRRQEGEFTHLSPDPNVIYFSPNVDSSEYASEAQRIRQPSLEQIVEESYQITATSPRNSPSVIKSSNLVSPLYNNLLSSGSGKRPHSNIGESPVAQPIAFQTSDQPLKQKTERGNAQEDEQDEKHSNVIFHVDSNAVSHATREAPSTNQKPKSAILDQGSPVITADEMIIVTERPKREEQAVTRNAVLVDSKYQNNFDHFQEYKVHEPESSS